MYLRDYRLNLVDIMVRNLFSLALITFTGVAVLFATTNPEKLPAAVFIGLFALLYGFCYTILGLAGALLNRIDVISWGTTRIKRTAIAIACLPTFLLVLQSIGQLTVRDILLTVGLFVLLYLYFGRVFIKDTGPK